MRKVAGWFNMFKSRLEVKEMYFRWLRKTKEGNQNEKQLRKKLGHILKSM